MQWISDLTAKLNLLHNSLFFFKRHFTTLVALGLIAAFGRVTQLGGFGEIPFWLNIVLEVVVETSRILLFLFVLGVANIKRGADLIRRIFSGKINLKIYSAIAIQKFKSQWVQISWSIAGFILIAMTINYCIDVLAYQTCLYISLKSKGILVDTSSEWTILLFFKNILIVPFTLVFETLLLLWILNKKVLEY